MKNEASVVHVIYYKMSCPNKHFQQEKYHTNIT